MTGDAEPVRLHDARLFPGGGGRDDTAAARDWMRKTLDTHGLSAAWPVADALITAARTRRPWWLSLRADESTVVVQILRARTHHALRLPDPIPGLADGVRHTYGTARTPDGLCLWATIATGPVIPPGVDDHH
ncbi:hypothetical protein ACL02R_02010 [Streptomyces sp. MS19]|uniref:hypothetical protein n=1 Tax=Streptomyces sp. MS19 TaxID=3385972 RepID=UPI00399F92B7